MPLVLCLYLYAGLFIPSYLLTFPPSYLQFFSLPPSLISHFRIPTSDFKVFIFRHLRHFVFLHFAAAGHGKFGDQLILPRNLVSRQVRPNVGCHLIQIELTAAFQLDPDGDFLTFFVPGVLNPNTWTSETSGSK